MLPIHSVSCVALDTFDSVTVATTYCEDFDQFSALPKAVSVNGKVLGLSGWNSDRGLAYYRSDRTVLAVRS